MTTQKLPLEGVRVLSLTVVWAGVYASQLLGDLGAEIIRMEAIQRFASTTRNVMARPPAGIYENDTSGGWFNYPDRSPGERPWNRTTFFNCHGRNQRAITLDLENSKGMDLFKRLVKVSDLFIENNAPKVVENLGITYEMMSEINPGIIMIRAPGYGTSGPLRDWRGYGTNVDGVLSHMWLNQYSSDDIARRTGVFSMDTTGGSTIVMSALMALRHREKTGKGQLIEVAQAETVLSMLAEPFSDYYMNGRLQETMGNRLPAALQGCYRCTGEDDWIVVTITNDEQWKGLCRALGNPAWTKDEKFSDEMIRYRNHDDLDKHIEEWTSTRDKYEAMKLLQKEGVPAGPVLNERDAYNDPQMNDRGFFVEMTQKWSGTHKYPGFPWRYTHIPQKAYLPPPGLGEHNEYVYKEILKMSDVEYAELEREQIIGDVYLPNVR
ncbi:MAG: CoA transferase [Syntrophales bacterium LBB04]|nr:CoA transferase [Syntrophales bacterium LBB04]